MRRQLAHRLVDHGRQVERDDRPGVGRQHAQRGEDRVDRLVKPLDLLQRRAFPVRGVGCLGVDRVAPARGTAEQLDIRAHDGQRRAQRVGHDRDQVGARLIDRAQAVELRLRLALQSVALDDAGEERRERLEERDVTPGELAPALGLDVEHADDLVVPDQAARNTSTCTAACRRHGCSGNARRGGR